MRGAGPLRSRSSEALRDAKKAAAAPLTDEKKEEPGHSGLSGKSEVVLNKHYAMDAEKAPRGDAETYCPLTDEKKEKLGHGVLSGRLLGGLLDGGIRQRLLLRSSSYKNEFILCIRAVGRWKRCVSDTDVAISSSGRRMMRKETSKRRTLQLHVVSQSFNK